jgi:hypothetical protein
MHLAAWTGTRVSWAGRLVRHAALAVALLLPPAGLAPVHAQSAAPRLELRPGIAFEVVELKRLSEKTVVALTFAIDNQSQETTSLADLGLSDNDLRITDLKLIDFQGGKDYWLGSTGGSCLCSTFEDGAAIGPGERREFWAWFGAPPAGVSKLAVFVPGVPPLFDVPLAK